MFLFFFSWRLRLINFHLLNFRKSFRYALLIVTSFFLEVTPTLQKCLFSNPGLLFLAPCLLYTTLFLPLRVFVGQISDMIRAKPWISRFGLGEPTDKVLTQEKPDTWVIFQLSQLTVNEPHSADRARKDRENKEQWACGQALPWRSCRWVSSL